MTALTDITHSSLNTVSRRLREKGYSSRIARTKPYLSKDNIEARFLWASNNRETDWETVMFTDESTFTIGETGKERVIRKKGTEWELSHLAGGGNVCVWGAIMYGHCLPLVRFELAKRKQSKGVVTRGETVSSKSLLQANPGGSLERLHQSGSSGGYRRSCGGRWGAYTLQGEV